MDEDMEGKIWVVEATNMKPTSNDDTFQSSRTTNRLQSLAG